MSLEFIKIYWERESFRGCVRGIYIGWRTVFNGNTGWQKRYVNDSTKGFYGFAHTEKKEVWVIVVNERHDPVLAFPEDVSWTDENGGKNKH